MAALYIFGGLLVVVIVALTVFKIKWHRENSIELRAREARIETVVKIEPREK